jgi:hypothetical protein
MKYAEAWKELKSRIEEDANDPGLTKSMAEWISQTSSAKYYLELINKLEEKFE